MPFAVILLQPRSTICLLLTVPNTTVYVSFFNRQNQINFKKNAWWANQCGNNCMSISTQFEGYWIFINALCCSWNGYSHHSCLIWTNKSPPSRLLWMVQTKTLRWMNVQVEQRRIVFLPAHPLKILQSLVEESFNILEVPHTKSKRFL